jgi:hypothetical protein
MKPLFGITYSPPKRGKTLAMLRAFPSGLFFCLPGGLDCVSWLGLETANINQKVCDTVDDIIAEIKKAGKKYPAIIVDDASLQFDQEYLRIKGKDATWKGNDKFNQKILELRDASRDAAVPVFWTMHEASPREVKKPGENYGKLIPGTVAVAGWQLPEKLPAMASFVARIVHDDKAFGKWPYVYQIGPDPEFITGSRIDFGVTMFPPNIGELLRSTGEDVPRLKGFEWMEGVAETLSTRMLDKPTEVKDTVREAAAKLLEKKVSQRHIRWALADSFDRANLKRYRANLLDTYLDNFDTVTME